MESLSTTWLVLVQLAGEVALLGDAGTLPELEPAADRQGDSESV